MADLLTPTMLLAMKAVNVALIGGISTQAVFPKRLAPCVPPGTISKLDDIEEDPCLPKPA